MDLTAVLAGGPYLGALDHDAKDQDASFVDIADARRDRRLGIEAIVVGRQRRNPCP
jgi:hypothetical protein